MIECVITRYLIEKYDLKEQKDKGSYARSNSDVGLIFKLFYRDVDGNTYFYDFISIDESWKIVNPDAFLASGLNTGIWMEFQIESISSLILLITTEGI